MGRPLLRPDLRKNWTHSVNFYEGEYRAVYLTAVRKGIAISNFIREAVKEKLEREKEAVA